MSTSITTLAKFTYVKKFYCPRYQAAKNYATMALETGLLTSANSIAKAHIRRASALRGLGAFGDALEG